MLDSCLQELESKIKKLDEITGFKKSITEYNKISQELQQCRCSIEELEKFIESGCDNIDCKPIEQITDEEYAQNMKEIKDVAEIFEHLNIDEQIKLYQKLQQMISSCDTYIKSHKMEIVYLDKKI